MSDATVQCLGWAVGSYAVGQEILCFYGNWRFITTFRYAPFRFFTWIYDVRGSVHHSIQFIKKNPTRCNNVSKFYYSIFIWSSTCFGRHIAHHQELKTALAASGFSYVEGCWMCNWWTLSGKFNKMQQCTKILLFHIYMKLNMFRATHRPSSGA